MSYKNETGHFTVPLNHKQPNGSQLKLYYQRWVPSNAKTGHNVVIHHGLGEHSGRYGNVLGALEGTGVTIYSSDVRGHGQSEGKKGLAENLQQLADDLSIFLDFIQKEHNVTKPLLYGHSMGGATALTFVAPKSNQERLTALLVTGPALGVDKTCYQTVMIGLVSCLRHVIPSVTLPSGLDVNNLSHDKNYVEAYKSDPLTHDLLALSLAYSLVNDGDELIRKTASEMMLPIFLGHGESDKICTPHGTQAYYKNCGSSKKTLKIFPGLVHEVHNETKEERDKVLEDIKAFITEQLRYEMIMICL